MVIHSCRHVSETSAMQPVRTRLSERAFFLTSLGNKGRVPKTWRGVRPCTLAYERQQERSLPLESASIAPASWRRAKGSGGVRREVLHQNSEIESHEHFQLFQKGNGNAPRCAALEKVVLQYLFSCSKLSECFLKARCRGSILHAFCTCGLLHDKE
jgi:hypothetical protein